MSRKDKGGGFEQKEMKQETGDDESGDKQKVCDVSTRQGPQHVSSGRMWTQRVRTDLRSTSPQAAA